MNHALFVKPHRINRKETVKVDLVIPFLVINHPQLFVRSFDHAMMSGTQHFVPAMHDGIAFEFFKRTER